MAERKPSKSDASLPFAALQLLAPPVRLVSAALWKVMKQRDVMQYGIVEEFVTSACETVPGLLTVRHQGKLALGLRARLILELCRSQPDEKVITPHLERVRAPAALSASSASTMKRDVKIMKTVENFHSFIGTLLADPAEREQFFKEEFQAEYGPEFDQELEKLLWEFLIRLDQLLPVPNLAQTVSWLSGAPPVLAECARAATQPQLLKVLLQHQSCLGHLETAASLPPNMGDSILDSLSLPPSGRVPSNQATEAQKSTVDQSTGTQTRDNTPFITPVIGLISNENVPVMMALRGDKPASSKDAVKEHLDPKDVFPAVKQEQKSREDGDQEEEESNASKRTSGIKRKQPEERESDEDGEEEEFDLIRARKKSRSLRDGASSLRKGRGDERTHETERGGVKTIRDEEREVLETSTTRLGVKTLRLPEDPSLCSIFVSCLSRQPRVVIERLSVASVCEDRTDRGGRRSNTTAQNQRRKSPAPKSACSQPQRRGLDFPGVDDKENRPVPSPSRQRRNAETPVLSGDGDDYVADSEDEATKNFKGRLFMKRYYKTKHGTYVPTLREYWKPRTTQLSSAGSKRR